MKKEVKEIDRTTKELSVEATISDLKHVIDAAYKDIKKNAKFDGFRKGKIPNALIDQRFGKQYVINEVVNKAINLYIREGVGEHDIVPLMQPSVNYTSLPTNLHATQDSDDNVLKFTATFETLPSIDLPELKDITITVDEVKVEDEEIEKEIEALREQQALVKTVDRAAKEGDVAVIDASLKVGDKELDKVENFKYEIEKENVMIDGLNEALIGMKKGEEKTFPTKFIKEAVAAKVKDPKVDEDGKVAGEVHVKLVEVKEKTLPEADDEFAKSASDKNTLKELKDFIRENILDRKKTQQKANAKPKLIDELVSKTFIPMPPKFFASALQDTMNRAKEGEKAKGKPSEIDEQAKAKMEEELTNDLNKEFVIEELTKRINVEPTREEFLEYINNMAMAYGMNPQQFIAQMTQANQLAPMMNELRFGKALDVAINSITIKDEAGNVISSPEDEEDKNSSTEEKTEEAKKTSAKKTSAKKTSAKKTSTEKTATKKTTAKKTTAKKTTGKKSGTGAKSTTGKSTTKK